MVASSAEMTAYSEGEHGRREINIGRQTIRKLRIRILPYVLLLYIISYLDRINIGFAALTMNQELGITNQQFGLVVGFFFHHVCAELLGKSLKICT